jgi:hypothetical protein
MLRQAQHEDLVLSLSKDEGGSISGDGGFQLLRGGGAMAQPSGIRLRIIQDAA